MAVIYQPQIEEPADPLMPPPPLPPKRPKSMLRNPSDRSTGPPPRVPTTNISNTTSASLLSLVSAQEWTVDQVCQWLALDTRLERYIDSFRKFGISGHTLLQMRNDNFQALGIFDDTDRATLKRRLRELKAADHKIQQERQRSSLLAADGSPQQTSTSSLPGVGGQPQPQPPPPALGVSAAVLSQSAMDQTAGVRSPNLARHTNTNPNPNANPSQPPAPAVLFMENRALNNTYTPLSPRLAPRQPPATAPLPPPPPPPPTGAVHAMPTSFNAPNMAMLPPVLHPPPPASASARQVPVQVPASPLPVAPQPPLPQHLGKNLGGAQQPTRPGSVAAHRPPAPPGTGARPDPRDAQGRGGANAGNKVHLSQV